MSTTIFPEGYEEATQRITANLRDGPATKPGYREQVAGELGIDPKMDLTDIEDDNFNLPHF